MTSAISVSHLCKTYASGFQALKDINLDIPHGEIFALLGPNGAGKTTLINVICGIVKPSAGTVTVDGHDILADYRASRTMSHIARRNSTSTPAVGSSRNRIRGSCDSAFAIMTRRFMPPDSVMILESRLSQSDSSLSTFSMMAGFGGLPNRPREKRMVAGGVSNASVVNSCGTRPIMVREAR